MKKIDISTKTYPNTFTLVDNDLYDYLNQWKWHYDNGYAFRRSYFKDNGKLKYVNVYMHDLIIEKNGLTIDHIDRNGLNNCKSNLRNATWAQNMQNRKTSKNNTKTKGVFFSNTGKRIKRWMAQISVNKKRIYLGRYLTKQEASEAYDKAAKSYFGEFACLNNTL